MGVECSNLLVIFVQNGFSIPRLHIRITSINVRCRSYNSRPFGKANRQHLLVIIKMRNNLPSLWKTDRSVMKNVFSISIYQSTLTSTLTLLRPGPFLPLGPLQPNPRKHVQRKESTWTSVLGKQAPLAMQTSHPLSRAGRQVGK